MTGLHGLSGLHASLISGKGRAVGVSAQPSLTESNGVTGHASAIWAAGHGSPLHSASPVPAKASHMKGNYKWRTELQEGNYCPSYRGQSQTANFLLSAACEHLV